MCNHKCHCCGPCCCCKDHVETAFILGLAYIISNVLFFEILPFGIAMDNHFTLMYIIACKIFHPIQYAVLIFAAHKRSSPAILAWITLTAIICTGHVILGKIIYLVDNIIWNGLWLFVRKKNIWISVRKHLNFTFKIPCNSHWFQCCGPCCCWRKKTCEKSFSTFQSFFVHYFQVFRIVWGKLSFLFCIFLLLICIFLSLIWVFLVASKDLAIFVFNF